MSDSKNNKTLTVKIEQKKPITTNKTIKTPDRKAQLSEHTGDAKSKVPTLQAEGTHVPPPKPKSK